ncbi:CotD family spore coat protein [Heyndrickxia acidiproducens]|uniref:CotD family spore coat protein n=1 Tax=Heyndrickxia acidiproducens TaxID=1121084 RepID=UPI00037CC548|nr:CotD family spore coat protein [Heyndrickxia acidiproducens]
MFRHHCRPHVLPAVVHPTKCCVTHTHQDFIVPHIFPTHTTHVNHQVYHQQNYFPHTHSFVNETDPGTVTNFCDPGRRPGCC